MFSLTILNTLLLMSSMLHPHAYFVKVAYFLSKHAKGRMGAWITLSSSTAIT